WIISAFQLTFASFLLLSGRLSDVANPKHTFVIATAGIGCISIATGFLSSTIPFIAFRAMAGVMGAMTIPSALTLLVGIFPEPHEQARVIGAFGGSDGVGNGKLYSTASLRPGLLTHALDTGGISLLTVSDILFIFALTEGSMDIWISVKVLLPLLLSIALMIGFFVWEHVIPTHIAAVPPRTWFYRNFAVLFVVALLPYLWFTTMFDINMVLWQEVYDWSSLICALRLIPSGVVTFSISLTGPLARRISPKWIILFGMALMIIANILFVYADNPSRHWSFVLPAIIVGDAGAMLVYTHANIAIFETTPPRTAGTVGAIFNGALQLGSAVSVEAITSIETSIERTHGGFTSYAGHAAAWWFLVGVVAAEALAVAAFYRTSSAVALSDAEVKIDDKASAEPVAPPNSEKPGHSVGASNTAKPLSVDTPAFEKTFNKLGLAPGKVPRVTTHATQLESLPLPSQVH
ncbi:uncharacterized protein PHACADRAFT_89746, partial [Phanerochaete carnosa HHB-10118-sp]